MIACFDCLLLLSSRTIKILLANLCCDLRYNFQLLSRANFYDTGQVAWRALDCEIELVQRDFNPCLVIG